MEIEKLTPIEGLIVNELCRAIGDLGGGYGILSILGSWGDTLPESEILSMLKEYNNFNKQPQRQPTQHTSDVGNDRLQYAKPHHGLKHL